MNSDDGVLQKIEKKYEPAICERIQVSINTLISLGSNATSPTGGSESTLKSAIAALKSESIQVESSSKAYLTPAFPPGSGPDFRNAVVKVSTDLDPPQLLARLHEIEAKFARVRTERWGARSLDLDLIAYADLVLPNRQTVQHWIDLPLEQQMAHAPEQLIVPHPRVQDRSFVLVPLCDVAPEWVHPILGKTARQMLDARPSAEKSAISEI